MIVAPPVRAVGWKLAVPISRMPKAWTLTLVVGLPRLVLPVTRSGPLATTIEPPVKPLPSPRVRIELSLFKSVRPVPVKVSNTTWLLRPASRLPPVSLIRTTTL